MPELPEVRNICDMYKPLVNQTINYVIYSNAKFLINTPPEKACADMIGTKISAIHSKGKYIIIDLSNGSHLITHLMLARSLFFKATNFSQRYIYVLGLDNGQLSFEDARGFGRWWYYTSGKDYTLCGIDKLGPEFDDKDFTVDYLRSHLGAKPIKQTLMQQEIIAGIGNIYADEILFEAGVNPYTVASYLRDKADVLYKAIVKIMKWGIAIQHITMEQYLLGGGHKFPNAPLLRVYGRNGQHCLRCHSIIERGEINNRKTYYCPNCQKEYSC